jgi:carboxymethylenebutenolidase
MGERISLRAADGHTFSAYRALPATPARGGVVVIQEVFGVNAHIRDVCDRFAAAGYGAVAPALFDRLARGVELDYDEDGISRGRELALALGWEQPLLDVAAAARALERQGRVGYVGYCWGGSISFLAGCRLDAVACAAIYYGRHIVDFLGERPRCPLLMHFGAEDALIPAENVAKVRAAFPEVPVFVYEGAGHGFNCDRRADFRAGAAMLAFARTLDLFARHLG